MNSFVAVASNLID